MSKCMNTCNVYYAHKFEYNYSATTRKTSDKNFLVYKSIIEIPLILYFFWKNKLAAIWFKRGPSLSRPQNRFGMYLELIFAETNHRRIQRRKDLRLCLGLSEQLLHLVFSMTNSMLFLKDRSPLIWGLREREIVPCFWVFHVPMTFVPWG